LSTRYAFVIIAKLQSSSLYSLTSFDISVYTYIQRTTQCFWEADWCERVWWCTTTVGRPH